jgi:hypothetical protein
VDDGTKVIIISGNGKKMLRFIKKRSIFYKTSHHDNSGSTHIIALHKKGSTLFHYDK